MFYCIIGVVSILVFLLFVGFVLKGMIIDGLVKEYMFIFWLMLVFVVVGVFYYLGIKIFYFVFFVYDSGRWVKDVFMSM